MLSMRSRMARAHENAWSSIGSPSSVTGMSAAMSADGQVVAFGDPFFNFDHAHNGGTGPGRLTIYRDPGQRNTNWDDHGGDIWQNDPKWPQAYENGDGFGLSVSLSAYTCCYATLEYYYGNYALAADAQIAADVADGGDAEPQQKRPREAHEGGA